MEKMHTSQTKESVLMTAVTAVLYFCAILMFSYQFIM